MQDVKAETFIKKTLSDFGITMRVFMKKFKVPEGTLRMFSSDCEGRFSPKVIYALLSFSPRHFLDFVRQCSRVKYVEVENNTFKFVYLYHDSRSNVCDIVAEGRVYTIEEFFKEDFEFSFPEQLTPYHIRVREDKRLIGRKTSDS